MTLVTGGSGQWYIVAHMSGAACLSADVCGKLHASMRASMGECSWLEIRLALYVCRRMYALL